MSPVKVWLGQWSNGCKVAAQVKGIGTDIAMVGDGILPRCEGDHPTPLEPDGD
jgi:hypothetical protein